MQKKWVKRDCMADVGVLKLRITKEARRLWTDGYRKARNEEISTWSSRQLKCAPKESFPNLRAVSISKASHNVAKQFISSRKGRLIGMFWMILSRGGIVKRIQG